MVKASLKRTLSKDDNTVLLPRTTKSFTLAQNLSWSKQVAYFGINRLLTVYRSHA